MKREAYQDTSVPVERSKEAIRQLLRKHGVEGVHFAEDWTLHRIGLSFVTTKTLPDGGKLPIMVKKTVYLWAKKKRPYVSDRYQQTQVEQRERQVWRALYHHLKAQMEAVAFGLMDFEDVFLADIVAKDGRLIGDHIKEAIAGGHLALPAIASTNEHT